MTHGSEGGRSKMGGDGASDKIARADMSSPILGPMSLLQQMPSSGCQATHNGAVNWDFNHCTCIMI